jgi:hypothetical protein
VLDDFGTKEARTALKAWRQQNKKRGLQHGLEREDAIRASDRGTETG